MFCPILQTEAMKVVDKMNIKDFKATNVRLETFKKRYGIVWKQVSSEANNVNQETVEGKSKDVYNGDETGHFLDIFLLSR